MRQVRPSSVVYSPVPNFHWFSAHIHHLGKTRAIELLQRASTICLPRRKPRTLIWDYLKQYGPLVASHWIADQRNNLSRTLNASSVGSEPWPCHQKYKPDLRSIEGGMSPLIGWHFLTFRRWRHYLLGATHPQSWGWRSSHLKKVAHSSLTLKKFWMGSCSVTSHHAFVTHWPIQPIRTTLENELRHCSPHNVVLMDTNTLYIYIYIYIKCF